MIRRVTSYDGALLEEAHPKCTDVVSPTSRAHDRHARGIIRFGTGVQAKALAARGREDGNDTGLHRCLVCGLHTAAHRRRVVGFDDKQISLVKKKPARAPHFPFGSNSCRGPSPERP